MPQIIVTADRPNEHGKGPVMLSERVNATDFESEHFAARLVERLGWAVTDAQEAEEERLRERERRLGSAPRRR
jgi:hypothetical protein